MASFSMEDSSPNVDVLLRQFTSSLTLKLRSTPSSSSPLTDAAKALHLLSSVDEGSFGSHVSQPAKDPSLWKSVVSIFVLSSFCSDEPPYSAQ